MHRQEEFAVECVCLWKEPFYLKDLGLATTFPVPSSSNADSSLWSTDQLPPPSAPMKLLQDLPGPAVCCLGPPPTHPGPNRCSQHSLSLSSARSQRPLPGIPGTPQAQES